MKNTPEPRPGEVLVLARSLPFVLAVATGLALSHEARALPQTCPGGSPASVLQKQGCFPADCASLQSLDWGSGGVPPGVLSIDKFDPALGTLLGIDLVYKARFVGAGCMDNSNAACMVAQVSGALLSTMTASVANQPPVTGLGPAVLNSSAEITPSGFLLGASDGFDDCATPGVTQGPPSTGDCTPGEDHFVYSFDETFSQELDSLVGADLAAWIGAPGSVVTFDTTAFGLLAGTIGWAVNTSNQLSARVWIEATYHYCPSLRVGTAYCFCTTGSPCGNSAGPREGCANGTGVGAVISGSGSDSLSAADLVLHGAQLPAGQPGLFFQGDSAVGGTLGTIFGDGLRCAQGSVVRLEVVTADVSGHAATTLDIGTLGSVAAGDIRRYQLWYRDPLGSPCGSLFNLTNGLEITWTP